MAINFDEDRSGLLGIDTGVNYDQMAFNPGSLKDSLIKNLYNIEKDTGFSNPQLDKLKQQDMQQFQEKGTPLSLPSDAYTAMAISDYDDLFNPQTFTDAVGVNRFQGLRDLFNMTALGKEKEPMSIEDFQVQNIEGRPVASIPSNFLNYRFEDARTPFTPLREGLFSVKNTLDNLKDKGVDVGSAIVKGIGNLIIPGAGFLLSAMKETPQQKSVKDFYEKEFGLDNIGRIQSGIMAGYNPVYGFGGAGLQNAINKRLATILKTEEKKKKKGLKLSQELINRRKELEALKERDRIARANIAATPGFDVSGGGGGSYDRSFDYGARTREARDRRSSDLGFSDIRLKENIKLVGKSPSNINIYKFNYKDNPTTYQGVMAHEVPWANLKHSNGYMMVDYNKVDVEFKKWQK